MRLVQNLGQVTYRRVPYHDEADLESAILDVQAALFGPKRIYLDVKIELVKGGRAKALQNLRYTARKRLQDAKTLDDVW